MVYADDVSVLGENINTVKKDILSLLALTEGGWFRSKCRKIKYRFMSRRQSAGKNHNLMISDKSFRSVGKTITDWSIHEEIKSELNSGNAWYHIIQNVLPFRPISLNLKINTYIIINLPLVLYGHKTWSLTLKERHRFEVFRTGCWGEYLDLGRTKWREDGENYTMESFITRTIHKILGWQSQGGWDRRIV